MIKRLLVTFNVWRVWRGCYKKGFVRVCPSFVSIYKKVGDIDG